MLTLQAAYHNAKPANLAKQLIDIGLDEERSATFQQIWMEHGKSVISLLRKNSIATHQVNEAFCIMSKINGVSYLSAWHQVRS